MRQYFDFTYQENGTIGQNNIEFNVLKFLSDGLFEELILEKNTKILQQMHVFDKFSKGVVKRMFIAF